MSRRETASISGHSAQTNGTARGLANQRATATAASADVDGYESLRAVLEEAYAQAAHGKGKERHANDRAFVDQPIFSIGQMVGPGFNVGQAMKKAQEAMSMFSRGETDRAVHELLGAIVYTASAVHLMRDA